MPDAALNHPSVLVIDDEPAVLVLISAILKQNGMRTLVARSRIEAISLVSQADIPVDLVLADAFLKEMDGSELVAELRQIRPTLRALYMSAFSEDNVLRIETIQRGSPGPSGPIDNGQLVKAVRNALAAELVRASRAN